MVDRIDTDDGISLAYRSVGDGPAGVLFLHGWAGSAAYFDQTSTSRQAHTRRQLRSARSRGVRQGDEGYSLDRLAADTLA